MEDKYKFCYQCGGKLQEKIEIAFCPYCGEKVETDGDFCPFCGNALNEDNDSEKVVTQETDVKEPIVHNNTINSVSNKPVTNSSVKTGIHSSKTRKVQNNEIKKETKEETKAVTGIKFIAYAIGMIVLWVIFKFLIVGGVNVLRHEGFGLPFIIILLLAGCVLYFMLYRNND